MYKHNVLGYWSGLALCLTKVRSSRARCPVTALIGFPTRQFKSVQGSDEKGKCKQTSGNGTIGGKLPIQKPWWEKRN